MKKLSIILSVAVFASFLVSCKPESTLQKDIKYMPIRFKPLGRNDFTLVGNLQAETTISGTIKSQKMPDGSTKKLITLAKNLRSNMKEGLITKTESIEMMYFAPGSGEAITGSLYENPIFNTVGGTTSVGMRRARGGFSLFAMFFPNIAAARAAKTPADPGMEFGYYALIEKYPDVDYFINVRFDRKTVVSKKGNFTETIIVKADGVKLKTD